MIRILTIALTVLWCATAHAADISARNEPTSLIGMKLGLSTITISGQIGAGDAFRFKDSAAKAQAAGFPPRRVVLDGPGGDFQEAMAIGAYIAEHNIATLVRGGAVCTSSCAFIWLAGKPRWLYRTSQIGFHAPYPAGAPSRMINGPYMINGRSALIAMKYVKSIGLSDAVAQFTISALPHDARWLTENDIATLPLEVGHMEELDRLVAPK
jgi:hypothetical protein